MSNSVKPAVWKPQPRQALFMSRPEYEALYGGAAGGGKSDAIVIEALRQVHIPHYKALILRKTYTQLSELIDKTRNYYPRAYPEAKYNASTHTWHFPSGAKIIFGAMQYTKDREKYQGQAFDFIAFDELTHFSFDEYSYLFSRNRPNGPGTRCYIRATANPGGVGHGWVKERFISCAPPLTPISQEITWHEPSGKEVKSVQKRIFVPSRVFDNPALLSHDPQYVQRLAALPESEKKALLYGDWDTFSGQVFTEWRQDSNHFFDRKNTHVISPFAVPQSWRVWRGLDWGYSRPFSVGWYAVDHDRRLYRIRELYGCTEYPNTGVKWDPERVAREIKRIEQDDPNLRGRQVWGVADPAIWGSDGTESIASLMEKQGVYFTKGDHARIDGKMQVHNRLSFDENGVPMLYVFSSCRHFIRTFPALVYDSVNVEDIDSKGEDHIYDELRYVCMENPLAPRREERIRAKIYDPLSDGEKYDPYEFYKRY